MTEFPGGGALPAHTHAVELDQGHLSRSSLVALAVCSFTPAVGMAMVPMLMFATSGYHAWTSALLASVAVICIGLAVSAFARRFVATGSLYSYAGEVFGPWARLVTGAALFVGFLLQLAAVTATAGLFLGSFLTASGINGALGVAVQAAIYAVVLGLAGVVAIRGLDTSVRTVVILTLVTVPLVGLITVLSASHTGLHLSEQFGLPGMSVHGTFQGIAAGAAFLVSFESLTAMAAETKSPKKTVPFAVMSVLGIFGTLYVVTTVLQVPGLATQTEALAAGMSPPAALAELAGLGPAVAHATDLILASSMFAALVGFFNYGSRFLMTLSDDGLLPSATARVSRGSRTPTVAITVLAILTFGVVTSLVFVAGNVTTAFNAITTLVVYVWVPPYLIISAGAIALVIRERQWRPGLILAALIGFATMLWVYANGVVNPPPSPNGAMSWVALIVVSLVLVVFAVYARSKRNAREEASEFGVAQLRSQPE